MVAWYWLIVSAFCPLVVLYIPLIIRNVFFKLTIKPVSEERIKEVGLMPFKRWGNLCLFVDKGAYHLWEKYFFVRIEKKSIDK